MPEPKDPHPFVFPDGSTFSDRRQRTRSVPDEMRCNPEALTINTLIHPVLSALGYDSENPDHLLPEREHSTKGGNRKGGIRIDLTLRPARGVAVLMECKPLEMTRKDLQAFLPKLADRASNIGAVIAVLTTGKFWLVFAAPPDEHRISESPVLDVDLEHISGRELDMFLRLNREAFHPDFWRTEHLEGKAKDNARGAPISFATTTKIDLLLQKTPGAKASILRKAVDLKADKVSECIHDFEPYYQHAKDPGKSSPSLRIRLGKDEPLLEKLASSLAILRDLTGRRRLGIKSAAGFCLYLFYQDGGLSMGSANTVA